MPAGAIEHHHDLFAGMASGHLVEEHLHAVRVDVRQDQGIQHATRHIHRGVGVGVFVGEHGLAERPLSAAMVILFFY